MYSGKKTAGTYPRSVCGGGKGGSSAYDPQIGASAAQASATAAKAEQFSETYYNNVLTPLLKQSSQASTDAEGKLSDIYGLNADQMREQNQRYEQYGVPAENKYYDMVSQYSSPDEEERQAQAAKGDLGAAAAGQHTQMMQQFSGLGIDPSSPAAMSAMSDMAVQNSAAQASAMNRARNAARTMGMQLTSDAANFGRGGTSVISQFGNNASGNAIGGASVANGALGAASTAANGVMQGYQTAMSGYNNNTNAYSHLGAADIQAQSQGGFGQLLGSLGGAALSTMKPWSL